MLIKVFKVQILSFLLLFLIKFKLVSEITYYIKPYFLKKGAAFCIIFYNLNKHKNYYIEMFYDKKYKYKLYNISKYTLKLLGIPLKGPDKLTLMLYENNELVLEEIFMVHSINRGVSYVKVSNKYITPSRKFFKKIKEDYFKKEKAKKEVIPEQFFYAEPVFPVENGKIGTGFGYKRVYNKWKKSIHWGTDISAPKGTPIRTIFSGKVVLADYLYYTVNTIMVNHGDGFISLYAHLNKILVQKGKFVKKGDVIGLVGSTGRSTGPHLHFGIYINSIPVDPLSIFEIFKLHSKRR